MAGVMNKIGNSFYTQKIAGSVSMGDHLALAKEIIASLPNDDTSFCILHQFSGMRFAFGYIYMVIKNMVQSI